MSKSHQHKLQYTSRRRQVSVKTDQAKRLLKFLVIYGSIVAITAYAFYLAMRWGMDYRG